LSADLFAIGIDHVLVGLPEAHKRSAGGSRGSLPLRGWPASFRRCSPPSGSFPGCVSQER
jgi:hypothetical protein